MEAIMVDFSVLLKSLIFQIEVESFDGTNEANFIFIINYRLFLLA